MASKRAGSVPTLTGRVGTVALVALAGVSAATCRVPGTALAVSQRTFELTYVATVDAIPDGARTLQMWMPSPQSDDHQRIAALDVVSPYPTTVTRDAEFGNSILHLSVTDPERRAFSVSRRFHVTRHEQVNRGFEGPDDGLRSVASPPDPRWLAPDRLVPLDARIRAMADEVTRGTTTDLEKARAIYDYVVSTMRYDKSGTGWGNGDIYWACDTQSGNCTDFHALFTGLSRAVGIPAKFVIGFPVPPDGTTFRVEGYHCWAEFYLDGYGWVPVDASEASLHPEQRDYFFGAVDPHRVQFTVGRDIRLEPPQASDRLNYFIYPYVELDGRPHSRVTWTVHVQALDDGPPAHGNP